MRMLLAMGLALAGCSRHELIDTLLGDAHRPAIIMPGTHPGHGPGRDRYELLAGDLHCHVKPPDADWDVVRGLDETIVLSRTEGLDFIVLTPHVGARFFMDPSAREQVLAAQTQLRADIAASAHGDIVVIPGFEYTDHEYGHVGASFADLSAVLEDVPLAEATVHPQRFFERWVARGGLLVLNHPLITPLPGAIFPVARYDLSWRPITSPTLRVPPEIAKIDELTQAFEVFNLSAFDLRDRLLLALPRTSLDATFGALDARVTTRRRRIAAVGGSDTHSHHLRATTFLLSEGRKPQQIRDAITQGRTCVRDPAACSFEARAPGGRWVSIGEAIEGVTEVDVIATGSSIEVQLNGKLVSEPASDEIDRVAVPSACSSLRARVGAGFSAPIYLNCGL